MAHRFGPCCADAVADALASYGYEVHELPDWTVLGNGPLDVRALVWHHDASALGYSPGMAAYIQGQVRKHQPGANIWVGLDGGWRFLAAGTTYHAGKVLPGMPDNDDSAGVETDHTTGEDIGLDLLQSLRVGTAALVEHWDRDAACLHFHKTICAPPGRKTDPDGLDLATERRAVATEQGRLIVNAATVTEEDDDMPWTDEDRADQKAIRAALESINHHIAGKVEDNARLPRLLRAVEAIKQKIGA